MSVVSGKSHKWFMQQWSSIVTLEMIMQCPDYSQNDFCLKRFGCLYDDLIVFMMFVFAILSNLFPCDLSL